MGLLSLASCNADILINNGEITMPSENAGNSVTVPGGGSTGGGSSAGSVELSAPTRVNATKSFYADRINITWSAVSGADYYTIERAEHESETLTGLEQWTPVQQSMNGTAYMDSRDLKPSMYYSYKVTAHTVFGDVSPSSAVSTGTILAYPEQVTVSQGESETEIYILWDQMPYVDSYEIYMTTGDTISGVSSEKKATVAARSGTQNGFAYQIDPNREAGKELAFGIRSVGQTGNASEISSPRVGYTRVPGAPAQPQLDASTGITKGTDTAAITLRFKVDGEDPDFLIRKSSPGSSEIVVVDTTLSEAEKDKVTLNSDGEYEFRDVAVGSNIEYTYSVIAKNDLGMSQAASAKGYLLSPVTNVTLTPVNTDSRLGYELTYKLPVGSDDPDRPVGYEYEVVLIAKDGSTISQTTYGQDDIGSMETFFEFDRDVTPEEERGELRSVKITVSNTEGKSASSTSSNSIADIPEAIDSLTATSNARPLSSDIANSKGVYPVHIKWTTKSGASGLTLYRKAEDGTVVSFKVSGGAYDDTATDPLVKYEYWIESRDELGRTFGEPHAKDSYGAVTLTVFKDIFESVSLKPWEKQNYVPADYRTWWKNTKIATLVGYGNASDLATQMKALDDASANDHYRNGLIEYSADTEGFGGQIYFTYTNFGESANMWVNGRYEMHVDSGGNGSAASGSNGFDVYGMYPGHIGLGNIRVASKAFAGSYTIRYDYGDGSSATQEVNV